MQRRAQMPDPDRAISRLTVLCGDCRYLNYTVGWYPSFSSKQGKLRDVSRKIGFIMHTVIINCPTEQYYATTPYTSDYATTPYTSDYATTPYTSDYATTPYTSDYATTPYTSDYATTYTSASSSPETASSYSESNRPNI